MEQEIKSANILVVDDELGTRESLRMIMKDRFNVSTASNVAEGVRSLEKTKADIILLDIGMPEANGIDLLQRMQSANSATPIIIITAFPSSQAAITAFQNGAFDYISKPFEPSEILTVAEKALSDCTKQLREDRLVDNLRRAVCKNFFSTTEALLLAINVKDSYTLYHSKRVSRLCAFVAKELNIHPVEIEVLQYGAFLHDIGKIGISNEILMKKGTLTKEEFCSIKRHPEIGYKILEPINFLKESLSAVRYHHERYDGKGYPNGLKGDEIPYTAAILSIIDAYDTLTSERPYRKNFSHQNALEIIRMSIGTQFVPTLTEKVIVAINKYFKISKESK